MQILRNIQKSGKLCMMAVVRTSLQKVVVFLHRLQRMAVSSPRYQKLYKDIQAEIDAHNDIFKSVDGNRCKMVKSLGSTEEANFLQQRLDDMNQRWGDLKAKSGNIRAHLEVSAERWSRLLALLEELWRWLCLKEEDLTKQMPIAGDLPSLLQQHNHCLLLQDELKDREPLVLSTLDQARAFLADQPIEGPEEPGRNLQAKTGEAAT
uniref:Dystrophin n=1 Tax=Paramormyrops kingsleyae TaxID=1676925 RepID=A0A3B3SWX9_9TELE